MRKLKPCFLPYYDLVEIYCGARARLPEPLCMLCFEYAGLCGQGRRSSFFVLYA